MQHKMTSVHFGYMREYGHLMTLSQLCKEIGFHHTSVLKRLHILGVQTTRDKHSKKENKVISFEEYSLDFKPAKQVSNRPPAVYSNPNWEARIDEILSMEI